MKWSVQSQWCEWAQEKGAGKLVINMYYLRWEYIRCRQSFMVSRHGSKGYEDILSNISRRIMDVILEGKYLHALSKLMRMVETKFRHFNLFGYCSNKWNIILNPELHIFFIFFILCRRMNSGTGEKASNHPTRRRQRMILIHQRRAYPPPGLRSSPWDPRPMPTWKRPSSSTLGHHHMVKTQFLGKRRYNKNWDKKKNVSDIEAII